MERFAELVLRHRLLVIVGTIVLTGFFALGLTRLWVNSDIISYLKPDDPVVKLFNRIGEEYSGNLLAMVGIETDDVFSLSTLRLIRDLTEAFKSLDGVASVMSLTDILDIRKVEGGLEVRKLIDKDNLPSTSEELKRLREYVLSKKMYRGKIVSADGRITLIICRLRQDADRPGVARRIKEITESKRNGVKVYYSGLPLQILEAQGIILKDLKKLVPTVVLVVILVLFFSFRSIRGVVLPLTAVLIGTVWAIGLMGWLKVPLSIISNVTPVLLIAIGSAYGIHMISKYYEEGEEDRRAKTEKALSEVGMPILLSGLTTLIGFLSFIGAYITSITHFGVFTAIGVGFTMVISLSFIPAILSLLKTGEEQSNSGVNDHLFVRIMSRLADFILRREKIIIAVSLIIALVAIIGLPRIKREVNMLEYLPKDSDIRITEEMMRANFGGSIPIQIVVKGNMKDPFVLKEMRRMEKFLNSLPYASNAQSIADLICEMNKVMNDHPTIPETPEGVANLWFFIEGKDILKQLVNGDQTEGLIQAQLGTSDTAIGLEIVNSIDRYISRMSPKIEVVQVSLLNPDELTKAKEWLYSEIAEEIYFDATARDPDFKIESSSLKAVVRKALEADVVLTEGMLEELRRELRYYFEMESEVMVPENLIDPLVEGILKMASSGRTSKSEYLDLLRRTIPKDILDEDPEAADLTAETLAAKIREVWGKSKVQAAIAQLLPLFPQKLRDDPDFRDDLYEDLWVINEGVWGMPPGIDVKAVQREVEISAKQSGMPAVYKRLDRNLLKSQIQSFVIAFVLVFILLSIQHRSAKVGLITSSPILLTVLINFAVMAYAGVALDFATMMIASVAIGIGIDYSIHFSSRYKIELKRLLNPGPALARTLETTGRAILINALTVALGFSVLLMGQLTPIRQFGWMVAMTMIVSALSAITYLPAMLLVSKVEHKRKR
ncbi:MMPL family transporter [Candidatus Poribacteria bacterium]|nr:MMPL family transporter [Candidatus Poribacteria bacterium]